MSDWDPKQYEKFLKDRTQPAVDLAGRLASVNPSNILDMGCGPGNSSQVLKDRFPDARVIGADNSHEMIERAKELHPGIEFVILDINDDLQERNGRFDIVFSNACLQWLPDHRRLIPKMMTLLKANGVLAVQVPLQYEHPVHLIINELVKTEKWRGRLSPRGYHILSAEEYFDLLSGVSEDFEIWETVYCHRMPDYNSIIEWYKGTGLRPYLAQLSDKEAEEFIGNICALLKERYKVQQNGEILFRFPRLFFTAVKRGC